jgi:uncharacterized protein (DUF302 family)/glutaredoxin
MKLYQRIGCPHCAAVRRHLSNFRIPYQVVEVPKLGSERAALMALGGIDKPEVPVLVDDDQVIQGTQEILEHLVTNHPAGFYGDPAYGITRTLPGVVFADAVTAVKEALAGEGFGALTEIDVKATLKKKIGADFRNYVIVGACQPVLAHEALSAEPAVGLLLPCNVVVTEEDDGTVVVSAADPTHLFKIVGNPDVEPLAAEVGKRLRRVLAAMPTA